MNKNRLEALSDGVIAIVMTLLVLEFKVPKFESDTSSIGMAKDFLHNLPVLMSYIISFLVLIVWWMSHHHLFHGVNRVDRVTVFWNGIFLMCIAFIPYPTALIGEYPNQWFPSVLYGAVSLCCGVCYYGLYHRILKKNDDHPYTKTPGAFAFTSTWLHLSVYFVAIGVAFFVPYLSIAIYAFIPIYFFLRLG